MVTPNTLETMIEYTLLSNILDRICEMTTKPSEYPRDPTLLEPLKNLLEEIVNILKEDMENYHWATFTHAMEFFKNGQVFKSQFQNNFSHVYYKICQRKT